MRQYKLIFIGLGLVSAAVLLLVIAIGLIFKVAFWDKEILGINYKEEEILVCGVTAAMYPVEYVVDLTGIKVNRTGQVLFKNNCAPCHDIKEVVIGPALKNITRRRSRDWIHKFVSNSTALIKSGDPEAVQIFTEYNYMQMPSFTYELADAEIDSVINYIEQYSGAIPDIPYPVE